VGEVTVQPCVCLITTLKLLKNADKGEWHAPATNIIVLDELLTIIANISNLLPAFKCEGEGRIFVRSTLLPSRLGSLRKIGSTHIGPALMENPG